MSGASGPTGRHVVVSPHLDDAVLSASWPLWHHGADVVTVCAGAPPPHSPRGWWDLRTGVRDPRARVAQRIAEDEAALRLFGLRSAARLDFLDGQHRRAPLAVDQVARALRPLLSSAERVWGPAAIGEHPDHVAVNRALRSLAAEDATGWDLMVYADIPYCLDDSWRAVLSDPAASPPAGWRSIDGELLRLKRAAATSYRTQLAALGLDAAACRQVDALSGERFWAVGADA